MRDPLFTPPRVLGCHAADQQFYVRRYRRSAGGSRFPTPESTKGSPVPANQRSWWHDHQSATPVEEASQLRKHERSAAVVGLVFFSRSWNGASCFRKNRFSATSAVRLRNAARQNLLESATTICNAKVSFETCPDTLNASKWSHAYPIDFTTSSNFCGPQVVLASGEFASHEHMRVPFDRLGAI
jgi:hypothetical protein